MVTIPLKLPAILSIAAALSTIGYGLGAYKQNAGWSQSDADGFEYTIKSFVGAFSMDVDWDGVEEGLEATEDLGTNLQNLAKGIKEWEDIDFDIEIVRGNISRILSTLPSVFADIGKMNKAGNQGAPNFLGFTFARGNVEDGIQSSMDMGENLTNLAKGVKEWETIDFDLKPVQKNVSMILSTLPHVFAGVGKMNKGGKPDNWLGQMFMSGDVEEGVESSKEMGQILIDLAEGVKQWETIDFNVDDVTANVQSVLIALPKAFAEVGRQAKATEGIFTDSDHIRGAEVVQEFVEPIKAVASLVESFNSKNPDPSKLQKTMVTVFSTMGAVGQYIDQKSANRLNYLGSIMEKISDAFPDFNEGLKDFQEIMNDISTDTVEGFLAIAEAIENLAKIKYIDVNVKKGKLNSIAGEIVGEATGKSAKSPAQIKKAVKDEAAADKAKGMAADKIPEMLQTIASLLDNLLQTTAGSTEELEDIKNNLKKGIKTFSNDGL